MTQRPLIGLNCDYRASNQGTPAYCYLAAGYFDSIANAGGIPVLVPPMADQACLDQMLDRLDGFVLVGGADLDPRNDGYMLHSSVRPSAFARSLR